MLRNKKVVIFDLDGTLINSMGIWNEIDEKLIKTISKIDIDIDNFGIGRQRDLKLKEYSKCEDAYLEYCGFLKEKYKSDLTKEDIIKLRYEIADKYLKEVIDYKPNAEELLKYLKEKGYMLVLATTTGNNAIEKYKKYNRNIINKANFEDMFTLICAKESVKNVKPDPEVHYKILEELNVKKEECIIIEDSIIGIEAAKNAGIEAVAIYDKFSDIDREEINKLSKYRFNNFLEMLKYIKEELENV